MVGSTLHNESKIWILYPQASKTILIVKERIEAKATAIFGKSGIKISTRGERHMGAVVGSERFKVEYVSKKVEKWVQDIEQLSNIAKDEPQAALPVLLPELYPTGGHMYREPCPALVTYSSH